MSRIQRPNTSNKNLRAVMDRSGPKAAQRREARHSQSDSLPPHLTLKSQILLQSTRAILPSYSPEVYKLISVQNFVIIMKMCVPLCLKCTVLMLYK